jgi:group I intron endonuclease
MATVNGIKCIPVRKPGVYQIVNVVTGHVYVGSTATLGRRLKGHFRHLARGIHGNPYLQHAYDKYGVDAFGCEVLEECEIAILLDREQHWLDKLDAANHLYGYNICPRADRKTHAESTREKLRQAATGFKHSEETRKQISEALKGRPKDPESIRKKQATVKARGIPSSMKGKKQSEHHRRAIAEALRGNTNFRGRSHTPETIEKMSAAQLRRRCQERSMATEEASGDEIWSV